MKRLPTDLILPSPARWGTIDMTADDVAAHAARGITRLVVGPASTDLSEQENQISAFAARLAPGP